MISLKQLRHFRTVYEHGSMRDASIALSISQPALTASIAKLEEQLASQLFVRTSNGMQPTEFANQIVLQSYEIINRANALQTTADEYLQFGRGSIRMGVQQGILRSVLEDFFPKFVSRFPDLKYSIVERSSDELVETILRDHIDIAIAGYRGIQAHEGIRSRQLMDLEFQPLVRAGHPLAAKRKVSLKNLAQFPMTSPEAVPRHVPIYRALVDTGVTDIRIPAIACADYRMLHKIVSSTDAFMTAPKTGFRDEIADGSLIPLKVASFDMTFKVGVIDRDGQFQTPAVQMFIDELKMFFED